MFAFVSFRKRIWWWWNQEQMFADKQFLAWYFFVSRNVISFVCLREISPHRDFSSINVKARKKTKHFGVSFGEEFNFATQWIFFCVLFRFWINHDCNGIYCCWDLSHALKHQFLRALVEDKTISSECLLLSIQCRVLFISKLIYSKNGATTKRKLFNWVSRLSQQRQLHPFYFRKEISWWLCGCFGATVNIELLIIFNDCVRSIHFAELPLQSLLNSFIRRVFLEWKTFQLGNSFIKLAVINDENWALSIIFPLAIFL